MHRRAQQVFTEVATQVGDRDLATQTPCSQWTVLDLLKHVQDGNQATVGHLGGSEVPLPDGDRGQQLAAAAERAHEAFAAPGALDGTVQLGFGEIPVGVFAAIRSGDLYAHAWDLATALETSTDLDPELGAAVMAATAPVLSPALRADGGPFGPEQPCGEDRSQADRFAAFLGRSVGD